MLVLATPDVPPALLAQIRQLVATAFEGDFSDDDWDHTTGGWHVIAREGGTVVSHAAVVPRTITVDQRDFDAGYVEGVATSPDRQGQGLGSTVMTDVSQLVQQRFELGVLSTARHSFYERAGWERWQGPTFVRAGERLIRTADEDDGIMVLRVGGSQQIDLAAAITCDERTGDDW